MLVTNAKYMKGLYFAVASIDFGSFDRLVTKTGVIFVIGTPIAANCCNQAGPQFPFVDFFLLLI